MTTRTVQQQDKKNPTKKEQSALYIEVARLRTEVSRLQDENSRLNIRIMSLERENNRLTHHPITGLRNKATFFKKRFAIVKTAVDSDVGRYLIGGGKNLTGQDTSALNTAIALADADGLGYANNLWQDHSIGDKVLKAAGECLDTLIYSADNLGFEGGEAFHLSGDEFAVILQGCPYGAERPAIATALKHMEENLQVPQVDIPTSISVGTCHMLEALHMYYLFYEQYPHLKPSMSRDIYTRALQFIGEIAEARAYREKIQKRLTLLVELKVQNISAEKYHLVQRHLLRAITVTNTQIDAFAELIRTDNGQTPSLDQARDLVLAITDYCNNLSKDLVSEIRTKHQDAVDAVDHEDDLRRIFIQETVNNITFIPRT